MPPESRPESAPCVVLDTNLFVAACWNPTSASATIIAMCRSGDLRALITDAIVRELRRIVPRAVRSRPACLEQMESFIASAGRVTAVEVPERSEDPDDQKFLECAAAGADFLITSDDHLLRMRQVAQAEIVKPSAFLRRISCPAD